MPAVGWAGDYIGIPFKDHGRTRAGVDCWGLVKLILSEQFGYIYLPEPEYENTNDVLSIPGAIQLEAEKWPKVQQGAFGDLVVFNICDKPMHVGFCLSDSYMLHIQSGAQGSVIEQYTGPRWRNRIEGIYRYG